MSEGVKNRIAKEIEEKTGLLSLTSCGLTAVPSQLTKMDWLRELYLNVNQLTRIENLESLTNLQLLFLAGNQLTRIENIELLANLQKLYLHDNQLSYIENLESLTKLRVLGLYNNQLTRIANLKSLTSLQELYLHNNRLVQIENLEALINLQILSLSNNQLTRIENLESLTNLRELYLQDNQLTRIENLEALINLQKLNLSNNPLTDLNQLKELVDRPALKELYLYGITKNNLNIPAEVFGKDKEENCLPMLRSYFESIKKGITRSREVPVIFVGNSTAGKTSLLHFLKEGIFPPPQDCSTHGVEPELWQPTKEALAAFQNAAGLETVQFYFWDFGGQEYYHATHRLFFSKEAVYVLVWEKNTDKEGEEAIPIRLAQPDGTVKEVVQPVELFPYTYWLDTIRFFVPNPFLAPIVLVQNKLDTAAKERPPTNLFNQFGITETFHLSVKEAAATKPAGKPYRAFEDFVEHLFEVAKTHVTKLARQMHWEGAKDLLRHRRADNVWTPQQMLMHLQTLDKSITEGSLTSYLISLHSNGFLFYYPDEEEIKNCIFINPAWVTETIYAILDETVRKAGGEFDREKVAEKSGGEHAGALIALMKKVELIFENPESGLLIAPQYLPPRPKDVGSWNKLKARFAEFASPTFYLRFADFMPRSIMLRFLAAYGASAVGQNYWKNGIAFMLEGKEAVVMHDSAGKGFKVFVEDAEPYVQRLILDKLRQLLTNADNLLIGQNEEDLVRYSELNQYYRNDEVATVSGKLVACAPLRHFVTDLQLLRGPIEDNDDKQVKIFISYAHEDEDIKNLLVNTHLKAIQNAYDDTLLTWTDEGIKPGSNWDAKIKKEIEKANIILFLISPSFLASDYIRHTEIKNALERFKEKKQIIVPLYIESVSKRLLPFKDKQYLPGGTPLEEYEPKSKAWTKIQDGIIALIDDIKKGTTDEYFE